ncbi:hypothetical protein ACP70R_002672 [Stipagrostis hirtigluma subsp. patula]
MKKKKDWGRFADTKEDDEGLPEMKKSTRKEQQQEYSQHKEDGTQGTESVTQMQIEDKISAQDSTTKLPEQLPDERHINIDATVTNVGLKDCIRFAQDLLQDRSSVQKMAEYNYYSELVKGNGNHTIPNMSHEESTIYIATDTGDKMQHIYTAEQEDMSIVLSQGGTSYTRLMEEVTKKAQRNMEQYEFDDPMFGSYMELLQQPTPFENSMLITTSRVQDFDQHESTYQYEEHTEKVHEHQMEYVSYGDQYEVENQNVQVTSSGEGNSPTCSNTNAAEEEQNLSWLNEENNDNGEADNIQSKDNNTEDDTSDTYDEDCIMKDCEMMEQAEEKAKEVEEKYIPVLGQSFQTATEARKFYNEYAYAAGFSITTWQTYRCQDKKDPMFGKITRYTYKCSMKGRKAKNEEEAAGVQSSRTYKKSTTTPPTPAPNPKKRKSRKQITSNCAAEMIVTYENDQWNVTRLNLEHNHQMARKAEKNMLKSQVQITDQEKFLIDTFSQVNIEDRKIMAILTYIRGDITPYRKKHISNLKNRMRTQHSDGDMMQVLQWFSEMQASDPMFFYTFDTDDKKKVKNIFWANGNSRRYYEEFGDCISFDTTYNTNKYNMKFAPMVGITGHGDNCLFACAFLADETIPTFQWLFKTFLKCMGNKHPKSIITDQDAAMRAAIRTIFPNTNHRNCFFHIAKKAVERGGPTFRMEKNKTLHVDLFDILRKCTTEHEFEMLYQQLPKKYNVSGFTYLGEMWKIRKHFVPVYFKHEFYPFINTTARSEGTNATFKLDVGPRYSILRFMKEYKRISETTAQNMIEQDYITRTTYPWLSTDYELEKQAARLYNRKIFLKFQKELKDRTKYQIQEIQKNVHYAVFKTEHHAKQEYRNRRYTVTMDLEQKDFGCICCKFSKDGILCSHILKTLEYCNIFELPEKYFIDRWRPKERKNISRSESLIPEIEIANSSQLRYNILSRKLCAIASDGAETVERFNYIMTEAKNMESQLAGMRSGKEEHAEKTQPEGSVVLQDPDTSIPKGRPISVKRTVGIMELKRTKRTITCKHCGSHEHNIKRCDKHDLPPVRPKKKKKSTSAGGSQIGTHEAKDNNLVD